MPEFHHILALVGLTLASAICAQPVDQTLSDNIRDERVKLPIILKEWHSLQLCQTAGELLRRTASIVEAPTLAFNALPIVQAEMRRRSLRLNVEQVLSKNIKVGDSECHLIAAWGPHQDMRKYGNTSGVTTQWVYSSQSYVYTQNGRIISWQN